MTVLWVALAILVLALLGWLTAILIDSPEPPGRHHAAPAQRPCLRALHDTGTWLASEINAAAEHTPVAPGLAQLARIWGDLKS